MKHYCNTSTLFDRRSSGLATKDEEEIQKNVSLLTVREETLGPGAFWWRGNAHCMYVFQSGRRSDGEYSTYPTTLLTDVNLCFHARLISL